MAGHDQYAKHLYGEKLYARLPKSVLAAAAWYLADICSESGAGHGEALERLAHELEMLAAQDIVPAAQAARAVKALRSRA